MGRRVIAPTLKSKKKKEFFKNEDAMGSLGQDEVNKHLHYISPRRRGRKGYKTSFEK